jgi:hypothetical protein
MGKRIALENRFWSKVEKTDKCWNWTAHISTNGYGTLKVNGKQEQASRIAWILTYGIIPYSLLICHSCDNRACVNPSHLFIGTQRDNIMDAINKGRFTPLKSGELHHSAKLTIPEVKKIKSLLKSGVNKSVIAKQFNITSRNIRFMELGRCWANIT